MKRLVFNKFYWGISNDPNVWGAGSVYNAENIEIRQDSKNVSLIKWNIGYTKLATNSAYRVMGYNVYDNTHYLRAHYDWQITNIFKSDIDNWSYIVDLNEPLYNIWNLTTTVWNYWFIIWATKIYKWLYDWVNYYSLWIYNDLSAWIVTNWDFSSATWWTGATWNWSIAWWLATHTAWSTAVLSQTLTTVNAQPYRIEVTTDWVISWSCVVKLAWVTIWTINATNQTLVWLRTAASTSELLEFVPDTWFTWSLGNVSVIVYNITSQSQAFNEKAPYIIINNFIYVWNGNKITEIDTTTSTWVFTDVLTIDLDYTIKWITKIWDQIFVYASNWASSRQYLWDWVTTTPSTSITWVDKNCVNVANWANQDYILTKTAYSNKIWLYLVNWYKLDKIFENTQNDNAYLERIYFDASYTNAIETIWSKLIIPWVEWVYGYWQHTPWLPTALSQDFKHLIWYTTAMSYVESSSNNIRVASYWSIDWVLWVYESLIQFATYNNLPYYSGWIETNPIVWECVSNIKTLEKITVWYKLQTSTYINIYTKNLDRTTKYATIPFDYTTIPTVWAVYTSWWNTYTVSSVTDLGNYCILHCTYTWTATVLDWTFTKSSWTWDSSFYTNRVRNWFKLIWTISDTTKRRATLSPGWTAEQFDELSIWIELLTSNTANTPKLNDINLYFNETNDD